MLCSECGAVRDPADVLEVVSVRGGTPPRYVCRPGIVGPKAVTCFRSSTLSAEYHRIRAIAGDGTGEDIGGHMGTGGIGGRVRG